MIGAYLDLIRGHHVLWWGGLTYLALRLRGGFPTDNIPCLAGLTMAALTAGGYTINDYFDLKVDRVNAPNRPLPSGRLHPSTAVRVAAAAFAASAALSAALGLGTFLVILADIVVLILYSRESKRLGWLKTAAVCWLEGSLFLLVILLLGRADRLVVLARLYTVLLAIFWECVKDIHDLRGDSLDETARTPATMLGERKLLFVARSALAGAIFVDYAAYFLGLVNYWMPLLAPIAAALFFQASRQKNPGLSSKWMTLAVYVQAAIILISIL